ncbi:MAG: response regulator [Epsilonproteobacteria bacterium]|nr:response regulator [Campylobacterota bacterium]
MSMRKVLLVEDEMIVALDIKNAISELQFDVIDIVTNFDDALKSVKANKPDIILMDINLKESKDGIETAIEIQKIKNIPIIYLTAFSDTETINRAIKTDPVGYLIKPFKREELKSTILLGLYKTNRSNQIHIDQHCQYLGFNYYYDPHTHNLYYDNIPFKLSSKEKTLLQLLIEAKGNIVPFSVLEYQLWPDGPIADSTLRTLIYRFRAKVEYKLIETIPSFGCKLNTLF